MNRDIYYTIEKEGHGLFKDRGSKFLAFAYHVNHEDEVKEYLEALKKEYHDARHHCFAFSIGLSVPQERACDDGEPANSAGKPILNQINARSLNNVMVVVVRYFGGILLGVSGLINAYREASKLALENAKITGKTIDQIFKIEFDYGQMNVIMKLIDQYKLKPFEQEFMERCMFKIRVRDSLAEQLMNDMERIEQLSWKKLE